jgi:large subunit ribosomal protein L29
MKAADLREKSVEDLAELQKTLVHDVFQNRLKNFTNRLDDTSAMRKSRRDLARVITVLRERSGGGAPKQVAKAEVQAKPAAAAVTAKPKAASKKSTKTAKSEKSEAK